MNCLNKLVVFSTNFLQAFVVFGISVGLGAYFHSNIIEGISVCVQTGLIAGLIVGIGACLGINLKYNFRFGSFLGCVCITVFVTKYGLKSGCLYSLVSAATFYITLILVKFRSIIRALK